MEVYKLGTIWGKSAPDFYEMIKNNSISLSHINDCNPKKNSIILIAKGHTIKAITILLEDCHPVTENEYLEELFEEYDIDFNNDTLVAKSKWIELKPEDYFLYQTQDGICQVQKPEIHQKTKSLISKYMEQENLNDRIELLEYKKQIILQGPPGTGKTKTAKDIAVEMLGLTDMKDLKDHEQFKIIQFHPSYTYEDFVRGIISVPNEKGEGVLFKTENKILADFAEKALNNNLKNYILIIDEINRANLPSVLGELIYALEYRGEIVESMYAIEKEKGRTDNKLVLPDNLYIIGTMNTADRSVGHIDYAIKRRFAFVDVLPETEPIHPLIKEDFVKISKLFIKEFDGTTRPEKIERAESLASDFRPEDIWLGHSYFICKDENGKNIDDELAKPILNMKLKYEIIPLLKEYIKDGILLETDQVKIVMNELISKNF